MSDNKEAPIFICPSFKDAVDTILYSNMYPEYFSSHFPAKKRYIFFGQKGLKKNEQIQRLMEGVPVKELVIDHDDDTTIDRLENFNISESDIIIIKNVHIMLYISQNPLIHEFANRLKMLDNFIIAISDVPIDSNVDFYKQFEETVVATTPTMDHLKDLYEYYTDVMVNHFQTQSIDIDVQLTPLDYLWLAQQSTSCHDEDIEMFMKKIFWYAMDKYRRNGSFIINRDLIEDLDNGLMYSQSSDGTLTIVERDAIQEQNQFLTRSKKGVNPRKRTRT